MSRADGPRRAEPVDEQRWLAVLARDRGADDRFVYGVVTTGIYCRPSCPARRPNRENVRFFPSATAAEEAGLRACRRCEPATDGPRRRRASQVARACRIIEEAEQPPRLDDLARRVGLSRAQLARSFRAELGITPRAYADARRADRFRRRLHEGVPVTAAIFDAGFTSTSRFYATAADRLGMRPSELGGGATGIHVRFAVAQCSLGAILVAATPRGVCAVDLGDDPDALVRALQDRFHGAHLAGDDPDFAALVAAVVALVDDPARGQDVPLDIHGTVFQERVWQALIEIPAGTTVSYAELASRLGAPGAARAVARACGANRVAVAVPCHRVVRTDGSLSGYRWGAERKAALLERERSAPPRP